MVDATGANADAVCGWPASHTVLVAAEAACVGIMLRVLKLLVRMRMLMLML